MIEIEKIGHQSGTEVNTLELVAKLAQLQADLVKDEVPIDLDVFEVMSQESRKIALAGYVLLFLGQTQ